MKTDEASKRKMDLEHRFRLSYAEKRPRGLPDTAASRASVTHGGTFCEKRSNEGGTAVILPFYFIEGQTFFICQEKQDRSRDR